MKYLCVCADRPVTYLYNTLHYYERHLRDRANLKRKLVHTIMSSLKVGSFFLSVFFLSIEYELASRSSLVYLVVRTTARLAGASAKPT